MDKLLKDWKENASIKEEENFQFIRSLKNKDSEIVDKRAKDLHEEAFKKIDCLQCGNCCKSIKPVLSDDDVKRMAKHLNIEEKELKNTYLELDEDRDWTFNTLPCPFLNENNNVCQIYSSRPKNCREFPHTNKEGFASRTYQHSWNTVVCPATYYIVEEMKGTID